MLRIVKLTDYATLLLTHLSRNGGELASAQCLAGELGLPAPTVAKILKRLARAELVRSHRGVNGGYCLTRAPEMISLAQVVAAIEGPVALTECALGGGNCALERACTTRSHWQSISQTVLGTLESLSIADMAAPMPRKE